ncbi:MAG: LysR substrate-binding domain-containing protein [Betaproteobacteria bacterium]
MPVRHPARRARAQQHGALRARRDAGPQVPQLSLGRGHARDAAHAGGAARARRPRARAGVQPAAPRSASRTRELYDEMLARLKPGVPPVVTTTSWEMLRSAARVGLGVAIVSEYLVGDRSGDVAFVPVRDLAARPAVLACCTRAGRRPSIAALTFVERLRERFRVLSGGARKMS